jgi:phage-related protein
MNFDQRNGYGNKAEQEFKVITSGTIIENMGEVGEPALKIAGTGTVVVTFTNTQKEFIKELGIEKTITTADVVTLASVSGTFFVDTEKARCYSFDGSYNIVNRNSNMTGLFQKIKKGRTVITWTGTVTKFEIPTRMGVL